MSEEQLKAFISKVQSDEGLQNKLKAEGADAVAIAKEAGFNITAAELMRYQAQAIGELSDEELENAAGGTADMAKDVTIALVLTPVILK